MQINIKDFVYCFITFVVLFLIFSIFTPKKVETKPEQPTYSLLILNGCQYIKTQFPQTPLVHLGNCTNHVVFTNKTPIVTNYFLSF